MKRNKYLYILIDPNDKFELPLFVGTVEEMAKHEGVTTSSIHSVYFNYKNGVNKHCKYRKVSLKNEKI